MHNRELLYILVRGTSKSTRVVYNLTKSQENTIKLISREKSIFSEVFLLFNRMYSFL